MKKILFLDVGRRVELVQAFRNAALFLGKEILIYGEDISDTAPALAFCDRRIRVCQIQNQRYVEILLKRCKEERIDIVIPTIDTNLLILAENKRQFEGQGIKILISSPEMVRICRDKNIISQFFIDCGLKAPIPVNDWKEYKGGYPAFIKPKDGSSSIGAYKIENEEELEACSLKVADYIVQPFIDGTEYTVDIFADFEGNPVYVVPRIRQTVRAGEVLKTQICLDAKIITECKILAERFKPCGPMTVQLIRNEKGNDYYIEINPRFGGGSPLSMKAGAKSAELLLQLLDREEFNKEQIIEGGTVYSRFDQSVCIRENPFLPIKGVIFDLDDTLYSEKEYIKSGYRAVAGYLGDIRLVDALWDYFEKRKPAIDEVLKWLGREDELGKCVEVYRQHKPELHLYDGVEELIRNLQEENIKVGVITDGRPSGQRNKIEALGLDKLIDDIIITDEIGGIQFRKPCDIAFRIMSRRWMIPYENIAYVWDNTAKDFQAPRQLGMQSICFKNVDGLYLTDNNECGAITVDRISELCERLLSSKARRH